MSLSIGQKVIRTGTLLWGMRNPQIALMLKPYGFSEAVLEEGWALFGKVKELRINRVLTPATNDSDIIEVVGAFENLWFPIVKAALDRRYPEVSAQLFLNLGRTNGKAAAYAVETFIDRLGEMERGEASFEKDGPEAREYLRSRGLTDSVIEEIAGKLDAKSEFASGEVPTPFDTEELNKAEAEMWAFYTDWSTVVRSVITDGNLLRILGFKKRSGGRTPKTPRVVITSEMSLPEATPVPQLPAE